MNEFFGDAGTPFFWGEVRGMEKKSYMKGLGQWLPWIALSAYGGAGVGLAQEIRLLSPVEVRAAQENLTGIAAAGSEGVVSSQRLAAVP
ncbi:MAG TPA: hypothetical protein PLN11_06775, partial [Ottowia sp.]|nr:hypothetical protein [Ottowia sp.]